VRLSRSLSNSSDVLICVDIVLRHRYAHDPVLSHPTTVPINVITASRAADRGIKTGADSAADYNDDAVEMQLPAAAAAAT